MIGTIVLGVLAFLFVAGIIDIGRNGPDPRLVSRRHRKAVGAKDAGGLVVLVCAVAAVGIVAGANGQGPLAEPMCDAADYSGGVVVCTPGTGGDRS